MNKKKERIEHLKFERKVNSFLISIFILFFFGLSYLLYLIDFLMESILIFLSLGVIYLIVYKILYLLDVRGLKRKWEV